MRALPDFVILGAPRSGTTWLLHRLAAHPGVFILPTEPHFFDRHYDRGIGWYQELFAEAGEGQLRGEKTPAYLAHPEAPARIAEHLPEARLIAILRDPVDRSVSHYRNLVAKDPELAGASLERVLAEVPAVTEASAYATGLGRYLDRFPRQRVEVWLYEELRDRPQRLLDSVCGFLGLAPLEAPPEVARPINASAPKLVRSRALAALGRRLDERGLAGAGRLVERLNRRPLPPVPPRLRAQLRERFDPEIAELERMLDRDLSAWRQGRTAAAAAGERG